MINKVTNIIYTLFLFLISIVIGIHHEPFVDEAQSFLIARDVSISYYITDIARQEGSPMLWFLWLKLLLCLGLPYSKIYLSSIIPNMLGVMLFVFKAPFSKIIRYTFPLTYFILYQYNIIARNYSFLLLAISTVAIIYPYRFDKKILYILAIIFLGSINMYSLILSGGLFALYLYEEYKYNKVDYITLIIYFIFGLFSIYLLKPNINNQYVYHWLNLHDYFIQNIATNLVCFLGYGFVNFYISISLLKLAVIGFGMAYFLLLIGILFTEYKKYFIFLMLPNLLFIYTMPFHLWHSGILILIVMLIFWLNPTVKMPKLQKVMVAIFIIAQIIASIFSINNDIRKNYSGAKDMYNFLQNNKIKIDNTNLYFYNGVSVCPYIESKNCTYWDWKKYSFQRKLEDNIQTFIINEEAYDVYMKHFSNIMNDNYQIKTFKSYATFGMEDISEMETFHLYYKDVTSND